MNFTLYPDKGPTSSPHPRTSKPTTDLFTKRCFDTVEKLWLQGTFIPSIPAQIQFFPFILYFLLSLPLVAHFGATVLTVGLTNHCHPELTLCPLSLTDPLSLLPLRLPSVVHLIDWLHSPRSHHLNSRNSTYLRMMFGYK